MSSTFRPRSLAVALASLLAALVLSAAAPASVTAGAREDLLASQLVRQINAARVIRALPVLQLDTTLATVARWRSGDMATRGYFSHAIPPTGRRVFSELDRRGLLRAYREQGDTAARDRLIAGESKAAAFTHALLVVGPACALTHGTAGLSFAALLFADSDLIKTFGLAGLLATLIAFIAVMTLVPLLGVLLIRKNSKIAERFKGGDTAVNGLRFVCGWIADRMVHHSGLYSLISIAVVVGLGTIYASLEPRYRLADQVPDKQQAVSASSRLDAKLTGANPIDILIEFPKGASLYAPGTLATIADVHTIVEKQAGVGNVWSVDTLRRWLAGDHTSNNTYR